MLVTLVLSLVLAAGPLPAPPQPAYFDAMLSWKSNKVYGFYGSYYYRYDVIGNCMDPGYPKTIAGNWAGMPFQKIDAAVNFQNGKAYFFSGNLYARWDVNTDRIDPGYPKYINPAWNLPWTQVDAAVNWNNGFVYFFNNASAQYVRYRIGATAPEGPASWTTSAWSGFPFPNVGAATSYGGNAYFSQGNSFARASMPSAAPQGGYPKNLSYFPDVDRSRVPAPPVATYPPARTYPPAVNNYPPPVATPPKNVGCKVNGTLVYVERNAYNQAVYKQWNGVTVQLQSANGYFQARLNQYVSQGYTTANAMSACVREDNLWVPGTTSVTKPSTLQDGTYGLNFSWFGFVGLKPGYYRVVVAGYPTLNRWVSFTAGGQKLNVKLEYP